jgi:hypothetical protein
MQQANRNRVFHEFRNGATRHLVTSGRHVDCYVLVGVVDGCLTLLFSVFRLVHPWN